MARHKDAMKRARQAAKRNLRNRSAKSEIHTLRRKFLEESEPEAKAEALRAVSSKLDKAARKGIIHPNKAARSKSRLARRLAEGS